MTERKPNRLIHEKSPYLLQHAYNPVDWYPWGIEAFEEAKAQDKPLFVSIGYSTCHWCHVMEKECFEDSQVAELMNQAFVCIKVDREERPDLDGVYMAACQALGRNCGWPLSVLMTPDKNPFFIASYIPKISRYGMVGLLDLIPQIEEIWRTRRTEMDSIGTEVKQRIEELEKTKQPETEIDKDALDLAYGQFVLNFDQENGGFGNAPKFPSPHNQLFLLRYWNRTKEKTALSMVEKTLQSMSMGGIFDQLGFGFHRYSTDAQWLVPHFEKMLYDQASLILAYTEAYQAKNNEAFMRIAKETIAYVLRDLASPEGGFYSAEDADSEGEEGKFYLWTENEIKQALPPENAELAIKLFGVKTEGNYNESSIGRNGKNILHMPKPLRQVALESNLSVDELERELEEIREALFKFREKRVHPSKDDKILADWNGLMAAALARASRVFGETSYLQAATKASDFILKMQDEKGLLYHRFAKGETAIEGFLDDYAYAVFGLVEVYEACFEEKYLQAALDLTRKMIGLFWDEKNGGFYLTSKVDESVPRIKQVYDGAVPSGNSMALLNLLRLARLSNESSFEDIANKVLKAFSEEIQIQPTAHTFMLVGLDFALGPSYTVVLVGDRDSADMDAIFDALKRNYLPNLTVTLKISETMGYEKIGGKATAYVCRDQTCMPPTNSVEKMLELLGLPR